MPTSVFGADVQAVFGSASTPSIVTVAVDSGNQSISVPFASPPDWRFRPLSGINRTSACPPSRLPRSRVSECSGGSGRRQHRGARGVLGRGNSRFESESPARQFQYSTQQYPRAHGVRFAACGSGGSESVPEVDGSVTNGPLLVLPVTGPTAGSSNRPAAAALKGRRIRC
jgi:hypothetical protein